MNSKHALIAVLVLGALAVGAPAGASPAERAAAGPRIVEASYYEDLEDGRRHNVDAKIRGEADSVSARIGVERSSGHESGHISEGGRGNLWFFRDRGFVSEVRAQLVTSGAATIKVKARGGGVAKRKLCTLEYRPDPMYGDTAAGECRKP